MISVIYDGKYSFSYPKILRIFEKDPINLLDESEIKATYFQGFHFVIVESLFEIAYGLNMYIVYFDPTKIRIR